MDTELLKKYLDMFKISLIILGVGLLVGIFLLAKIVPSSITYFKNTTKIEEAGKTLATKE